MPDTRFFKSAGPFKVSALAELSSSTIADQHFVDKDIIDVAPIESAGSDQVSFLDNPLYVGAFSKSNAGVCVVHPDKASHAPEGMVLLLSETPYLSYAKIASAFYPELDSIDKTADTAFVHPTAVIGKKSTIKPGVVIGARAEIGSQCEIGANCVIGPGVILGDQCKIGPAVSIQYALIGDRVRIFAGARIGEAGFGFASSESGHFTVPQLGRVIIGDETEIGANTTIDRGSAADTKIGKGCRIDNLVQIGHNVILGNGCIVVAQVGISGSTELDDFVVVGGQVGFTGHLKIGKGVQIAAQSGVMNDLPAGEKYSGSPAVPMRQWMQQAAMLRSIGRKKVRKDG
ncbi:MAG: UDP-3-O-(3-hydroxymyristoyl)glucosamine N-acyltransferase [Rhodospirillaceae bacterium]|nr:UDP-3-O-(3-hydroxymyristoyl)glucosamine N-acyltransferase [Rhodospirillaceae bacterium]|tara:strand:+ start:3673 stop:4704 length:1032 start_codon:yes stop_codon:yes gene_type:complete